jgi:hypothetical protein
MKLRSTVFCFALACFALAHGGGSLLGCSSNTVVVQPSGDAGTAAPCDPSQCAPKNECIADGQGVTKCRLPCAAQSECPFNYQCAANQPKNFCVKSSVELQKKDGQYGTPCKPTDGFDNNPACDASQGFACYAETPTDGAAYCTRYDCQSDLDCTGGYWCATINEAPNATTVKRSFGATRTVCLKRTYCAPCKGDIDCPVVDGKKQICATDANGAGFCTTECTANNQCALDAKCTDEGQPAKVCVPKAGVCKGDGSLCSPCYSDADCPDGACVKANYSTEKFCTVKSGVPCTDTARQCPAASNGWRVGCISTVDPDYPKDACVGVVRFDDGTRAQYVIGCWTGNRITQ